MIRYTIPNPLPTFALGTKLHAQSWHPIAGKVDVDPARGDLHINATTGTPVRFFLAARSETGALISDWDVTGTPTTIRVMHPVVNNDTLEHGWNDDSLGYSYASFEPPVVQTGRDEWSVPPSMFRNGVVQVFFTDTYAERDVYLQFVPVEDSAKHSSAMMNFRPGPTTNYLLEPTSQTVTPNQAFVMRPYELIVTPRDRYLNPTGGTIATSISARFPGELYRDQPGPDDVISSSVLVNGVTAFRLVSKIARIRGADEPR